MRNIVSGVLFVLGILLVAGLLAILSITATAEENCITSTSKEEIKERIKTQDRAPKGLENGEIVFISERGQRYQFSSNTHKIVKREQERVVTRTVARERAVCQAGTRNTFMLGGRKDYTGVQGYTNQSQTQGYVDGQKDLVIDASYIRRNIKDTGLGAGAGIDSNGTIRGIIGVDF